MAGTSFPPLLARLFVVSTLAITCAVAAPAFSSTWSLRTSSFNSKTGEIEITSKVGDADLDAINFQKVKDSPGSDLPEAIQALRDNFHVLFSSTLRATVSGVHAFRVTCDDGCRARIDGKLMTPVSAWRFQGATEYGFSADLVAGEPHDFEMELFEQGGQFDARFEVALPGSSQYNFVTSTISTPRGAATPATFVLGGRAFRVAARPSTPATATLESLPAAQRCHGSATGPVSLMAGFEVAPDDAVTAAVASRFAFATGCLMVASGKALRTRPGASSSSTSSSSSPSSLSKYCDEALAGKLVVGSGGSSATVDVTGDTQCSTRVLLSAPVSSLTGDDAKAAAAAGDAGPAWASDDSGGSVRALSFRGKLYASLHNAPPVSNAGGAQAATCVASGLFVVPDGGWAVAPDTAESRAAVLGLRNTFASTCLALAGGAAIDAVTGAACPKSTAPTVEFVGSGSSGSFVSVSSCPHSVLLVYDPSSAGAKGPTPPGAAKDTSVVTWDADALVSNPPEVPKTAIEIRGTQFASLTGLGARKRGRVCQDAAVRVPTGWSVLDATASSSGSAQVSSAQLEDRFGDAARFASFGTYCLSRREGNGKRAGDRKRRSCGGSSDVATVTLPDGTVYAAVTSCPSAVVVTRAKPPPGPNELCGVCTAWGDPHYTTFDGVKWDFYGKGEYWVVGAYEDAHPDPGQRTIDWSVRSLQEPVRTATKHSMLRVTYGKVAVEVRVLDGTRAGEPTLSVEGKGMDLADGASVTTSNAMRVTRRGVGVTSKNRALRTTYRIELPNAVAVEIRAGFWNLNLLDVRVELPNRYSGATGGLCGNCDGDRSNDFRSPTCTSAATEAALAGLSRKEKLKVLHPHGESWAIGKDGKHASDGKCGLPGSGSQADPGTATDDTGAPVSLPCEVVSPETALRASLACRAIGDEHLRTACEDDVCATGDTGAAGPALATEAAEIEDATGPADSCTTATITRTTAAAAGDPLTHNGFEYALLDNADPDSDTVGCQETPHRVPDGWRVAPDSALHRSALACHPWATECVVFDSGNSYTPTLAKCGSLELETSGQGLDCLAPTTCSRRILIVRDAPRASVLPASSVSILTAPWDDRTAVPSSTSALGGWTDANIVAGAEEASIKAVPEVSWSGRPGTGSVLVEGSPTGKEAGALLVVQVGAAASGSPGTTSNAVTYVSRDALGRGLSVSAWSRTTKDTQGGPETDDYSLYIDVVYQDGTRVAHVSRFPTGVHDWVRRSVDVVVDLDPSTGRPRAVDELRIFALYRRREGSASFSDFGVSILSDAPFNLLRDGLVPSKSPEWIILAGGETFVSVSAESGSSDPGTGSISINTRAVSESNLEKTSAGAYQGVTLPGDGGLTRAFGGINKLHTALYFGADVRTAAGESPSAYGSYRSVYVDATLEDGSSRFGTFEPVDPSPEVGELESTLPGAGPAWRRVERVHAYDGSVRTFTLNALVRHTATRTDFDGLYATPTCAAGSRANPANGFSHGDPHVRSLDALPEGPDGWFDVHNIGEFVFYQDPVSEIQVRHSVAGRASVNSAFHVRTPLMTVQVDRSTGKMEPVLRVNGRVNLAASASASDAATGARVAFIVRGNVAGAEATASYEISTYLPGTHPAAVDAGTAGAPLEHTFVVTAHRTTTGAQFLQAFVQVPQAFRGRTAGLLGNFDGNPANDLDLPDGTRNTDPSALARAWELDPSLSQSAFVRSATVDASRIRDTGFTAASVASLPAADVEAARAECIKSGITSSVLIRDCAFDAVAGGSAFAAASGNARTQEALPVGASMGSIVAGEASSQTGNESSGARGLFGNEHGTVALAVAAALFGFVAAVAA